MKRFLAALLIFLISVQNIRVTYGNDELISGQEDWSISTSVITSDENDQEATTQELSDDGNQENQDDGISILPNNTWHIQVNTLSSWSVQEELVSDADNTSWSLLDDLFFWSWDVDLLSGVSIFSSSMLHLAQNVSGINTGTTQTWQQQAKLFITEYFYHTKNSFIEITNLWDQEYSWSISLSGFAWVIAKKTWNTK